MRQRRPEEANLKMAKQYLTLASSSFQLDNLTSEYEGHLAIKEVVKLPFGVRSRLNKLLLLLKRAQRLTYFAKKTEHAIHL